MPRTPGPRYVGRVVGQWHFVVSSLAALLYLQRHPGPERCAPDAGDFTASAAHGGDAPVQAPVPARSGSQDVVDETKERSARGSPTAPNTQLEHALRGGKEKLVVLGAPTGSGKTCLTWRTLTKRWGIYVSLNEVNVGSSACIAAWAKLKSAGVPSWYQAVRLSASIFVGHLVVLQRLRELDSKLTPAEWLLWQLLDPGDHIKTLVCRFATTDDNTPGDLMHYLNAVGLEQPLVVVLDDAQVWLRERIEVPEHIWRRYRHDHPFTVLSAVVRYLHISSTGCRPTVHRVILAGTTEGMEEALAWTREEYYVPVATTVYAGALTEEQAVAFATWFGVSTQCAKDGFAALKANVGYRARFWALAVAKYLGMDDPSWCEAVQHTRQTLLLPAGRYSLVRSLKRRLARESSEEDANILATIAWAHYFVRQGMRIGGYYGEFIVSAGLGVATERGVRRDEPLAAAAVVTVLLETPAWAAVLHKAIVGGFPTATTVSASCAHAFLELVLASTLSRIMSEDDDTRRRMLATLCGLGNGALHKGSHACARDMLRAFLDASSTTSTATTSDAIAAVCTLPEMSPTGPGVVNATQAQNGNSVAMFWQCTCGAELSNAVDAVDTVVVGRMGWTEAQRLHGRHSQTAATVEAAAKFDQRVGFVLAPRQALNVDWIDAQGVVTTLPHSGAAPPHRVVVLDRRLLLTPELKKLFQLPEWLFMVPGYV